MIFKNVLRVFIILDKIYMLDLLKNIILSGLSNLNTYALTPELPL